MILLIVIFIGGFVCARARKGTWQIVVRAHARATLNKGRKMPRQGNFCPNFLLTQCAELIGVTNKREIFSEKLLKIWCKRQ